MVTHALETPREADPWLVGDRLCLRFLWSLHACAHMRTRRQHSRTAFSYVLERVCLPFLLLIHHFVYRCLKTLCSVMGTSWFVIPCLAQETLS